MVHETLQQMKSQFLEEQGALFMTNWETYLNDVQQIVPRTAVERFIERGEAMGGITAGMHFIIALLRNAEKAGTCPQFSLDDTLRSMPSEFGEKQAAEFRKNVVGYTTTAQKVAPTHAFKLMMDAIFHWLPNGGAYPFAENFRLGTMVGIELLLRFENQYAQVITRA